MIYLQKFKNPLITFSKVNAQQNEAYFIANKINPLKNLSTLSPRMYKYLPFDL